MVKKTSINELKTLKNIDAKGNKNSINAENGINCSEIAKKRTKLNMNLIELWFVLSPGRLGSIPELSAESCLEIKASEGEHAVSGEYWLDPGGSGTSHIVHCDMSTSTPSRSFW